MPASAAVRLHPHDNVLVATRDLPSGHEIATNTGTTPRFRTQSPVPLGHKVACQSIEVGSEILKYGQPIGIASQPISEGDWVHIHNVKLANRDRAYEFAGVESRRGPISTPTPRYFDGYRRASGAAGTRNYVAVISSVNCSASVSKAVARHFTADRLAVFPNIDGVVALTHPAGCAMQEAGLQHRILNRVLGGMAKHPNIGGYVLIGLGCEKGSLEYLIDDQKLVQIEGFAAPRPGPPTLTMQNLGGTAKTIAAGIALVESLLPLANDVHREPIPASELVVATQCGGSDGNSGVTANPALGVACDHLVDQGGTAILGETTEIVGAEHLLTRRSVSQDVGERLLERIAWWKWYAGVFGENVDDNRSAGNAAGGLTTIAEKSLGAVAKAGSRPLRAVLDYAEPVASTRGLIVMDSPGYDPASITGMVAGGANLVVFTTGRGSCFGCKPSPSIKIATNTPMFQRMEPDMDLDAGRILDGTPVEEIGLEIFEMMLRVASGTPTKSERQGLGDEEFVPWVIGPVL